MTTTPPKLTQPTYHVWMDPRPDVSPSSPELDDSELSYHLVRVRAGDQLRAELEAKRHGLGKPSDAPMHLSMMWLWAALVRTGDYAGKWSEFKTACVAYDTVDDDQGAGPGEGEPVVPTEDSTS